jgi:hypothetical protein
LHQDLEAWLKARDRYENRCWFRDFSYSSDQHLERHPGSQHPLDRAIAVMQEYFETAPTCLICPGDEWTDRVLEHALDVKLQLVSSYYLAIRHANRFVWSTHICAPYLDRPETKWFRSGLPVVGYFHDYEPATSGVSWMTKQIDQWREAGAQRFVDFREAAAALGMRLSLEESNNDLTLQIEREDDAPACPRPVPVNIRTHRGQLPNAVLCRQGSREQRIAVHRVSDKEGRISVPVHNDERSR